MSLLKAWINNFLITPEVIGRQGEKMTAAKLGWVSFCGKRLAWQKKGGETFFL